MTLRCVEFYDDVACDLLSPSPGERAASRGGGEEEDGYTGADCWKAAPDPADENDPGRDEGNKETRDTDWECDMLHDQRSVWIKVLIGVFYIFPLTAFVFSCFIQASPEGRQWAHPAKVAPANM